MNIVYITNVYPTKYRNMSPIVKNTMEQYLKYYKDDNIFLKILTKQNFFRTIFSLRKEIKEKNIDIIHIHFGGLYALLVILICQFTSTKKIISFHGTDIHGKLEKNGRYKEKIKIKINQLSSFISFIFIDKVDFVSRILIEFIPGFYSKLFKSKYNISVLGVDYNIFRPIEINEAKSILKLDQNINYILFVNNNNSLVKREGYAREIIQGLGDKFQMLKLENIPYDKLYLYFNSCLFLLITSENEGSPNIVREALACNLPIVSVDVGDIKDYIELTENSILIEKYNVYKAIRKIQDNLSLFAIRENTREKFESKISFQYTSEKLHHLYENLIKEDFNDE
jgi:glycosyltransferase involved in cell wall biosynthesis